MPGAALSFTLLKSAIPQCWTINVGRVCTIVLCVYTPAHTPYSMVPLFVEQHGKLPSQYVPKCSLGKEIAAYSFHFLPIVTTQSP